MEEEELKKAIWNKHYSNQEDFSKAIDEVFLAGQLAEREKFYYWLFDLKKGQKKWSTYQLIKIQKKLEELTKKVSEEMTE